MFREALDDHSLVQLILEPTRIDNTLDLICTNKPSSVVQTKVIPGISDHECPIAEFDLRPIRTQQRPRQIPMYGKADWQSYKQHIEKAGKGIVDSMDGNTDIDSVWAMLNDVIEEGLRLYVPHKQTKQLDSLPYITPQMRKLFRKRDRTYNRMKHLRKDVNNHRLAEKLQRKCKALKKSANVNYLKLIGVTWNL